MIKIYNQKKNQNEVNMFSQFDLSNIVSSKDEEMVIEPETKTDEVTSNEEMVIGSETKIEINVLTEEEKQILDHKLIALMKSGLSNKVDQLKELISKGANIHVKDKDGNNLLHIFNILSDEEMKFLIDQGIDINEKNSNGNTPLIYLCDHVKDKYLLEKIMLLLKYGANMDIQNNDGKTALHMLYYIRYGGIVVCAFECIDYLIHQGANYMIKDNKNKIPLNYVSNNSYLDIKKKILNHYCVIHSDIYEKLDSSYLKTNFINKGNVYIVKDKLPVFEYVDVSYTYSKMHDKWKNELETCSDKNISFNKEIYVSEKIHEVPKTLEEEFLQVTNPFKSFVENFLKSIRNNYDYIINYNLDNVSITCMKK